MATNKHFDDEYIVQMENALHAEPIPQFVFWEHVMEFIDLTTRVGETVRIMGPVFLAPEADPFANVHLGLNVRVDAQPTQLWSMNKQEITIDEYLLEKPLRLQEYDVRHSHHNLTDINIVTLSEHYHRNSDDRVEKRLSDNTFRSFAGAASAAAMTTANVFNSDYFVDAATTLANRLIPPFPDGNYVARIDPSTKGSLLKEQKVLDATTRGLRESAPIFTNEIGVWGGIRFAMSNNIKKVTVGTSNTFQASKAFVFGTSTFGLLPLGTSDNIVPRERLDFLRGRGTGPVVKAVGMPVEVRYRSDDDYGRFDDVIWIEHCEYRLLDPGVTINPAGGTFAGKTVGTDSRFLQVLYGYNAV